MSDGFCHPMTQQICRKPHRCINCGEPLDLGQSYCKQSGVYDGAWFTNRFHSECWESMIEEDYSFEFTPYSGERPAASMAGKGTTE